MLDRALPTPPPVQDSAVAHVMPASASRLTSLSAVVMSDLPSVPPIIPYWAEPVLPSGRGIDYANCKCYNPVVCANGINVN